MLSIKQCTYSRLLLLLALLASIALGSYFFFTKKKHVSVIDFSTLTTKKNIVPIAVIGSGPAGLSAALYGARSALHTVVFEGKTPGGQLTGTSYVENWPGTAKLLGSQLIEQNKKQAESFGALMVPDTIVSADLSQWPFVLKTEEGDEINALTVIIATGANPRILSDIKPVRGEKEYWGYGVTTCAVCDAPFYKDKAVIVVGGGDSAIEQATLLNAYANKIIMLVRGNAMRAAPAMQARLKDYPKISVLYNSEIEEITGDGTKVTGVKLINKKDNKQQELPIDGVFLAIGHNPNTEIFKDALEMDKEGYIILTSRSQKTNRPGVFSAGDVSDHVYRQAGVAAGDGIKAALDAIAFLQEHGYNDKVAQSFAQNLYEPAIKESLQPLPKLQANKDFDALAKEKDFVVIEAGADYCASCKSLMPIVQAVAQQLSDKAAFAQIDLGTKPDELVKRFKIAGIPSILVLKKGELIARYDQQVFTKKELTAILKDLMAH